MQRSFSNQFDNSTLETMMERYRAELLRYQRATPPGRPTLADNVPPPVVYDSIWDQDAVPAVERPRARIEAPPVILPPVVASELAPVFEPPALPEPVMEAAPEPVQAPEPAPVPEPEPALEPAPAVIAVPAAPAAESAPVCRCAYTNFEKCIGAYGLFRPYERMGRYTRAAFLQTPGEATPVLARFAADVPKGAADSMRCRRSFSVKFYCPDGEYDMPGEHLPVSVGADEATLGDCCAAMRASPVTGVRSRESLWSFLAAHPQALHAMLWLYSDLGTLGSYRAMDGYSPACVWINSNGERSAVKTRWLSRSRPRTLTRFEAEELAGSDPDAAARELIESIGAGEKVQYELAAQIIPPAELEKLDFDPFDPAAIWSEERFGLQKIGLLTLDRLPEHFERELSVNFGPEHIIAGIEYPAGFTSGADPLLYARKHLRAMGEFSRRTLISNIADELLILEPELLERVLILFTDADLEFGQAVMSALGG